MLHFGTGFFFKHCLFVFDMLAFVMDMLSVVCSHGVTLGSKAITLLVPRSINPRFIVLSCECDLLLSQEQPTVMHLNILSFLNEADKQTAGWSPGPHLNIKTIFPRYGDSHVKDKAVVRLSYLYYGDPYTGKTTSLYWDGPQLILMLLVTM